MSEQLAIHGGTPVRTKEFGPSHDFGDDDIAAFAEVVRSGNLAKGPKVAEFERKFAAKQGVKHAVTVNSGTSAMHTCIAAINPDPGDEFIVSAWCDGGSLKGLLFQNCVPVFVDIDDTYNMDPKDVEAKIAPRTRGIIAVHYFGNPCDMTALADIAQRHKLFLVEDFAQAHFAEHQGQVVGSMGHINAASFGGKHLSGGGGGVVLTDNDVLWERAVLFSDASLPRAGGPYGGRPYAHYFLAPQIKMNDMTAAVLLAQLPKVDGYIENKIRAAGNIIEGLDDIDEIVPQEVRPGDRHTYWTFGYTLDTDRLGCTSQEFADAVTGEGVRTVGPASGVSNMNGLHRHPMLTRPDTYGNSRFPFDYKRERPVDYRLVDLPYGEELMSRNVLMSMRPSFSEEDVEDIIQAIRKVAIHYRR